MDFRLFILTLVAGGLSMMAYLLGSFPTGYLVGKRQGIDIREHGSGSTGATNVWRVMGKGWGILVFAVDFLKGIVALGLGQLVYGSAHNWGVDLPAWGLPWVLTAMAGGAIVGHSLPVWLQWRGGKSVATGLGIMVYLHWQTAVMALTIWLVVMAFTRTVSLSSLIAAVSTPILLILWQGEIAYQLLAGVGALYIIYTHRANVQRLLKGEEHSFAPKI